jgi:hypothetical protein
MPAELSSTMFSLEKQPFGLWPENSGYPMIRKKFRDFRKSGVSRDFSEIEISEKK